MEAGGNLPMTAPTIQPVLQRDLIFGNDSAAYTEKLRNDIRIGKTIHEYRLVLSGISRNYKR